MATWIVGTELPLSVQREVLSAFIYRMTTEAQRQHPDLAKKMRSGGWRMPDRTDQDWLAHTRFAVTSAGRLDRRYRYCETTWS